MAFATDTYIIKGMRQDESDLLFNGNKEGLSFAFENFNMRFTTDTETTSLVATQEKGNTKCKVKITDKFFLELFEPSFYYDLEELPFKTIGHCVVDKYLVLFGKCVMDKTIGNPNERTISFSAGNDVILRLERKDNIFYGWLIYNSNELGFDLNYPLETLGNVETNLIKKVYFIDGINIPREVNVVNPDAGQLANINLGLDLSLKDKFSVKREYGVIGNYPVGKIRFFYTYFNDNFSETNIIDWSPFFDCSLNNQGGSPESLNHTTYAFNVSIENVDPAFKFVRIYFQLFTENDATKYQLKYIERAINSSNISFIMKYDDADIKNAERTYLDIKLTNSTFIPYTFAEKDGRVFYGNIKRSLPDTSHIDFTNSANVIFKHKLIGFENLDSNLAYKYEPNNTTFQYSNYEYMGFRKDNWYRFGIIAQYKTGEWSDVFYITDAQCDISSKTEIRYGEALVGTDVLPDRKPIKSEYYIPKAQLSPNIEFINNLRTLLQLGFKRIKPVCVVPPPQFRNVITQGISCSTLYTGGDRRLLRTSNSGLFAIPSYFFRPMPLFPTAYTVEDGYRFKPTYPYTIRNVGDLKIPENIYTTGADGAWFLNPTFTNEDFANYNSVFREWRHGFSLPPKDRINAELQSSDLSLNDYRYLVQKLNNNTAANAFAISPLFNNFNGVNLFGFYNGTDDVLFMNVYGNHEYSINRNAPNWYYQLKGQYKVLPWHDLRTTGYDSTVFIDESFCTLNSPEVDYDFERQVEPFYLNQNIEVVGFAQVTGSMVNIDIPDTQFKKTAGTDLIAVDCEEDFVVTGTCLRNLALKHGDRLNNDVIQYLNSTLTTSKLESNPFLPLCGPWWLDTMLVASFHHFIPQNTVAGNTQNPDDTCNIFGLDIAHKLTDDDGNEWSFGQNSIYNESTSGNEFIKKQYGVWFIRNFDLLFNKKNRKFKWTPSFYGETTKSLTRAESTAIGKAAYPYAVGRGTSSQRAAIFCDFLPSLSSIPASPWNAEQLAKYVNSWSFRSMTWNTINLTPSVKNDGYWNKWLANRTYIDSSTGGIIPIGTVTLPFDFFETTTINDVVLAVAVGDFRGTFSYYFNPFLNVIPGENFYKVTEPDENHTQYLYINHPFLLPHNTNYNNRNWIATGNATVLGQAYNYLSASTIDEDTYYFNGSEYGCHYYAPFSTNFVGAYFDPYYAHVIYPFMSNSRAPFCGTNDAYIQQDGDEDCRPSYNSTNSCLYSSCTNYVNTEHDFDNIDTYSAYYHAPRITQELRSLPDLSNIPFVDTTHTAISQLYLFNCSDNTQEGNTPKLYHNTYTLTAAMKWYRGFKSLHSSDNSIDDEQLISTGYDIDKDVIMGNLFFSGYLPQFFTKNGLLRYNNGDTELDSYTYKLSIDNTPGNSNDTVNNKNWAKDLDHFIDSNTNLIINLDFLSTPHIIYYNSPTINGIYSNTLHLLSDFYVENPLCTLTNADYNNYQFVPQFYWKEFVNEQYIEPINNAAHQVKSAIGWLKSTYPHCGHFESFMFNSLKRADDGQPFWNKNGNVFSEYPATTSRKNLQVEFNPKNLIQYDHRGKDRKLSDYWVLPISNMYNCDLIKQYTLNNKNPYTYQDGMSKEYWNWKMCGYTINLTEFLNSITTRRVVEYLEGDTYFQRYNCFKTISNDLIYSYLWDKDEDDTTAALGINDVTETASVMIESYTNLDGLYWAYSSTVDFRVSPLVHPFWNNMKQINPVYSIQDDICDVFKEIDKNYYNSSLTHYPTMITWSIKKQDGEVNDSWGIVPASNKILISGEMGSINKLLSFQDKIFCLQDHGLSVLNYDPQVISPTNTDSTLSIYLSDATKLQGATYISRNIGTLNKWSVAIGQQSFYWIDDTLKQICGYMKTDTARYTIVDMSSNYGFKSWSNANILSDNCVWNTNIFQSENKAFKTNYDLKNHDVYWANGEYCICYNELLDCFTSFYSYEKIPYKFNYLDECYSICNQTPSTENDTLWHDYSNYRRFLYTKPINSYVELLVNPSGQYDKVFNFIEYAAEKYNPQLKFDVALPNENPYNHVRINNTYQIGFSDLNKYNTQNKFKLWRTALPREIKNGKQTMNRIRGPWCKIKLENINANLKSKEYRDKLYYINVNYTIPEQPLKTNIHT